MRKAFEIGGVVAAAVLIIMGIATMLISMQGRSTVHNELSSQYIVGSSDMTPTGIAPEVKAITDSQANIAAQQKKYVLPVTTFTTVVAPSCSAAGKNVNQGSTARCFAEYMRIHALGSTGGLVYSQMGRYQAAADAPLKSTDFVGGTNDPTAAATDPKTHQPLTNGARDLWVTETALSTALNTSYMAERIAMFGLVVGISLLLTGIGFAILAIGGALRNPETAFKFLHREAKPTPTPVANS